MDIAADYQIEHEGFGVDARATVHRTGRLDTDLARQLYLELMDLHSQGMCEFNFNLHDLDYCDSMTIAAWIMIDRALATESANLKFNIRRDSQIHKAITASKLDHVFSLNVS